MIYYIYRYGLTRKATFVTCLYETVIEQVRVRCSCSSLLHSRHPPFEGFFPQIFGLSSLHKKACLLQPKALLLFRKEALKLLCNEHKDHCSPGARPAPCHCHTGMEQMVQKHRNAVCTRLCNSYSPASLPEDCSSQQSGLALVLTDLNVHRGCGFCHFSAFYSLSEPWDVQGVLHRANLCLGAHKACFISQGKWKSISKRTYLLHQLGYSYIHNLHLSARTTNKRCMTSVRAHHVLHQSVFMLHWQRAMALAVLISKKPDAARSEIPRLLQPLLHGSWQAALAGTSA